MKLRYALISTVLLAAFSIIAQAQGAPKVLRVYFIGNSVTDTINYAALAKLAESRGWKQEWGRHMIPGAPLFGMWRTAEEGKNAGFTQPPYGDSFKALDNYEWDAVTLQPFDRNFDDLYDKDTERINPQSDILYVQKYLDRITRKSPNAQVYIYARWPRMTINGRGVQYDPNNFGKDTNDPGKITDYARVDDFEARWNAPFEAQKYNNSNESKEYFEKLTRAMRNVNRDLKKPLLMVPVGHVMYALHQKLKAGQVPGYKSIYDVYADSIHLNNIGSYIVGCTFFATLYRENPRGLSGEPYKVTDPKLLESIQTTVWEVVSTHPLAGLTPATPPLQNGD